jgi:NADH-quinone oxidoreductase subunit M
MLIAILMLYFNSDLTQLAPEQVARANISAQSVGLEAGATPTEIAAALKQQDGAMHTFNMLALAEMGQNTGLFDKELLFGWSLQRWAFILLFIGFIIKVPSVPLHTWLPDAHVEAPTPISMILAGILLKMGGYGIIRICYPICPQAGFDLAWIVCAVGVVSMVYGAFAALAQTDFKRLVAYSSVSHMGYVVLGLGVWTLAADSQLMYSTPGWSDYWKMGTKGAMFQMIGHGISSAGMFFMVGVIYDRVHHRNLNQFGGLFGRMPLYTALAVGIFFAGLGLPGLCGFIGEVFVVLSVWNFSKLLAVISAFVVILTAGYILWAIQRVYLGPEYRGPHGDAIKPITLRELCVAVPLLVLALWFGVYPMTVFRYMDKSIDAQVEQLSDWSESYAQQKVVAAEEATAANSNSPNTIRPVSALNDQRMTDQAAAVMLTTDADRVMQPARPRSQIP